MSCVTSSVWLKIGTFVIGLVLVIHVVGFATTSWTRTDITFNYISVNFTMNVQMGLWQECVCVDIISLCTCTSPLSYPDWLIAVQVLEALGLAGLIIIGILTFIMLCGKPNQRLKIANINILPMSGICIASGVITFVVGINNINDWIGNIARQYYGNIDINLSVSISYSFILCAVAAGLTLFLCLPLFVLDMRSKASSDSQSTVFDSNQGQVNVPSWRQVSILNRNHTYGHRQDQSYYESPVLSYVYSRGYGGHLDIFNPEQNQYHYRVPTYGYR